MNVVADELKSAIDNRELRSELKALQFALAEIVKEGARKRVGSYTRMQMIALAALERYEKQD